MSAQASPGGFVMIGQSLGRVASWRQQWRLPRRLFHGWGEADRHVGWQGANWGGNCRWVGSTVLEPMCMAELQEGIRVSARVRAVGSAHSFTPLVSGGPAVEPDVTLVSLRRMPRVCYVSNNEITVSAGTTYSEVCAYLAANHPSLALPTTASLPHFAVAGAVASGTHGSSGMGADGRLLLSGLDEAVSSIELLGPDGTPRTLSDGDADFDCAVTSLGLLGIITKVTLRLCPAYSVRQRVYGNWPPQPSDTPTGQLARLLGSLPAAMRQTDSFSAFVQWHVDDGGMLILRDKVFTPGAPPLAPPAEEWLETGMALRHEPIEGFLEAEFGAFDATSEGPWHDKMHIWMRNATPFGPQAAAELQLEHFVPLVHAAEALERTQLVAEQWGTNLLYSEIRAVRGGSQVLSPYTCDEGEGYDTLAICNGFDGALGEDRVRAAAAVLEEALEPLRARPHWAKLFAYSPPQLEELYGTRMSRFRQVARAYDPDGKFSNEWCDRMVLGR